MGVFVPRHTGLRWNSGLPWIGLVALVGCRPAPAALAPTPPPPVIIRRPVERPINNYGEFTGWTQAKESVDVRAVPLVLAKGAGHEMRQQLGTGVFAGMLGVTVFGIFLTPVFYVVLRSFTGWKPKSEEAAAAEEKGKVRMRPVLCSVV